MWDVESNHRGLLPRPLCWTILIKSFFLLYVSTASFIKQGYPQRFELDPLQLSSPTPMRGSVNFCAFKNTNFLHGPMQNKEASDKQSGYLLHRHLLLS